MREPRHLRNVAVWIAIFSIAGCANSTDGESSGAGGLPPQESNVRFIEAVFPDQEAWDRVFSVAASHPACNGREVLSREKFLLAADRYPSFCGGARAISLHELAAFFANVSVETNGAAPGQVDGGLCYVEEVFCSGTTNPECPALCSSYCNDLTPPWNTSPHCPCGYYGRGALQITNPYNYHETSMEVFGDDRLYLEPDRILEGTTAWEASLAFWMNHEGGLAESSTTVPGLTTCHKAMTEHWDFGKTVEVINGDLECKNPGASYVAKTQARIAYYRHYVELFAALLGMEEDPTQDVQCADPTPPDPDEAKKVRCGANWTEANATCGTFCKTPDDCQAGEGCFADLSPEPCR